jgi:hypothetical protein
MENSEEKKQLDLDATLIETSHKVESFYESNKNVIKKNIDFLRIKMISDFF